MHVITTSFGDIACGASSSEHFFQCAAFNGQLDQAYADSNSKNAVFPDEMKLADFPHHFFGNMRRLFKRAPYQYQSKLITAQSANNIGIAHRRFDQGGHFAKQTITRKMPGNVVDLLESI